MALTKAGIAEALRDRDGYSRKKSVEVVETLIDLMKQRLASGEDVLISGFGKVCVKEKRRRRGRNPATGEALMLDARKVVTFKWSGKLRDRVNGL